MDGRTHWEGCWKEHLECAKERIYVLEEALLESCPPGCTHEGCRGKDGDKYEKGLQLACPHLRTYYTPRRPGRTCADCGIRRGL